MKLTLIALMALTFSLSAVAEDQSCLANTDKILKQMEQIYNANVQPENKGDLLAPRTAAYVVKMDGMKHTRRYKVPHENKKGQSWVNTYEITYNPMNCEIENFGLLTSGPKFTCINQKAALKVLKSHVEPLTGLVPSLDFPWLDLDKKESVLTGLKINEAMTQLRFSRGGYYTTGDVLDLSCDKSEECFGGYEIDCDGNIRPWSYHD